VSCGQDWGEVAAVCLVLADDRPRRRRHPLLGRRDIRLRRGERVPHAVDEPLLLGPQLGLGFGVLGELDMKHAEITGPGGEHAGFAAHP
jgi:hypothetical protein